MLRHIEAFWADESGASAIEYGLLAAILGMGLVYSLTALQGGMAGLFGVVASHVPDSEQD